MMSEIYGEMKLIPELDLDSISQLVWVNEKAKEKWSGAIPQIANLFHNLEVLSVIRGHRRCSWQTVDEKEYHNRIKAEWESQGLKCLAIHRVGQFEGFAHRHAPVIEGKPVSVCVIVARNDEDCKAYQNAFETGDNREQGILLGYPECCSQFFVDVWKKNYFDPVWQAACNPKTCIVESNIGYEDRYGPVLNHLDKGVHGDSHVDVDWYPKERKDMNKYGKNVHWVRVKGHPHSNSVLRYLGLRACFHIPCSFNCEPTIEVSEKRMELAREVDADLVKLLDALMRMPHSWDCYHALAVVRSPIFYSIAASEPSAERYVVEIEGDFIPKESATGAIFPFEQKKEEPHG